MYACVHLCMYVYVRMYVCMYVCVYVCMRVCMCVCVYVCMHACMHACMSYEITCMCIALIYVYMCVRMYARVYVRIHTCHERRHTHIERDNRGIRLVKGVNHVHAKVALDWIERCATSILCQLRAPGTLFRAVGCAACFVWMHSRWRLRPRLVSAQDARGHDSGGGGGGGGGGRRGILLRLGF